VLLALLLAQVLQPASPEGPLVTNPATMWSPAFFEAFPANGRGTFGPCSTTPPTGAKGEALIFARSSVATCTKSAAGGNATTGIASGDLVELTNNQPRVEYDSTSVASLRVEGPAQNINPRFIDFTNAAYADVGTPTPTTGQASPFSGTYATSAVMYDDNDPAGFEGRTITLTVTAGQPYTAHCYVRAGTLAKARIVLDGTAATLTGLSAATWSIIEATDASASAASVVFEIDNGAIAADTGSVIWGGCDVKLGTYRTTIVPTNGTPVTRGAERAYFTGSFPSGTQCLASTREGPVAAETQVWALTVTNPAGAGYGLGHYRTAGGFFSLITATVPVLSYGATLDGTDRVWMAADGTTISGAFAGATNSVASATTPSAATALCVGADCVSGSSSGHANGLINRIIYDVTTTRCR